MTSALKAAAGADLTYVDIFGDRVAHRHLDLAPHHDGGALR